MTGSKIVEVYDETYRVWRAYSTVATVGTVSKLSLMRYTKVRLEVRPCRVRKTEIVEWSLLLLWGRLNHERPQSQSATRW